MKKLLLTFVAMSAVFAASAQPFLAIDNEPRSVAMGGTGVSLSTGGMAIYNNVAAIALSDYKGAAAYSYAPYMWDYRGGRNLHSVSGFYQINNRHSVALGFRYFNDYDGIEVDATGNSLGKINPWGMTVEAGYAFRINDMMSVGANVRFINNDLGTKSTDAGTAVGFDIGYFFRKNGISAGLVVSNVGTQIDYGEEKYNTPGWVKAGASYEWNVAPKHAITGAAQFDYKFQPSDDDGVEVGIGVEYCYNKLVSVKGGFRFADNTMGYNYGSAGLGLNIGCAELGVVYIMAASKDPINKTIMGSLGVRF